MLTANQLNISLMAFIGSFALNFISIHSMANLILLKGSSKQKSANLSVQYALLTSTITLLLFFVANLVTSGNIVIEPIYAFYVLLSGEGTILFLVRWLYTKRVYNTTYLYALMITQWLYILIGMITLIITLNFTELPDVENFIKIENTTSN